MANRMRVSWWRRLASRVSKANIGLNLGIMSIRLDMDSNRDRENWARFVARLQDHRVFFDGLMFEVPSECMDSVMRLRNHTIPEAEKSLQADSTLWGPYSRIKQAIRDFLADLDRMGFGSELAKTELIHRTWDSRADDFHRAVDALRGKVYYQLYATCARLGVRVPEEFALADPRSVPRDNADAERRFLERWDQR